MARDRDATRSIAERDSRRLLGAIVAYPVVALLVVVSLDLSWWLLLVLLPLVFVLIPALARAMAARYTARVARGVRVEPVAAGVPARIQDRYAAAGLDGYDDPTTLRYTGADGERLIADLVAVRRRDGLVVVTVGQVVLAHSRLADGRWLITRPLDPNTLPGVLGQTVPDGDGPEILARHQDALDAAASRGLSAVPLDAVAAMQALEDIETELYATMTPKQRARAGADLLSPRRELRLLGADAF